MKCECDEEGVLDEAMQYIYHPVEELPFVVHEPGKCECTHWLRRFNRNGKEMWLCSNCFRSTDILLEGEDMKAPFDTVAKMMWEEIMKFDPLKPWAEMTDEDKGKFIILGRWFIYKLERAPMANWDEETKAHLRWPLLLVMLRCHGRPLRNVVVEYEADPEAFLAETERQRIRWEENLNACSLESGDGETVIDTEPVTEMRKVFDVMIKMVKRREAEGKEL